MDPDEDIFAIKFEPHAAIDMSDTPGVNNNVHDHNSHTNPTTPRRRAKQTVKTDPESAEEDAQTPSKKAKSSPGKRGGVLGPIPASYDEASHEDKTIMQMREGEGKSWAEIRKVLEDFTKGKIGASSLQIRYSRMKANFIVIQKDDEPALLQARKEVEEKMEQEKWQRVANILEVKTGNKYPSSAVLKKFKDLNKRGDSDIFVGQDEKLFVFYW